MRPHPYVLFVPAVVFFIFSALSCKKDKIVASPAAIMLINGMSDGTAVIPKFGPDTSTKYFSSMVRVNSRKYARFTSVAGVTPALVAPASDTNSRILSGNLNFVAGGIYSLFISGDVLHPDTMFIKENNLPYFTDSATAFRFVNLAGGGKSLTINLLNDSGNAQFPPLGYKQASDFKKYPDFYNTDTYTFEVRDQASGTLLTTYTEYYVPYLYFMYTTLVISGSTDAGGYVNVFPVYTFY